MGTVLEAILASSQQDLIDVAKHCYIDKYTFDAFEAVIINLINSW